MDTQSNISQSRSLKRLHDLVDAVLLETIPCRPLDEFEMEADRISWVPSIYASLSHSTLFYEMR